MASLLKKVLHQTGSRTPQDLVSRLCLALDKISESSTDKQQEDAAKLLYQMKVAIFGDGEVEPSKDNAVLICMEMCKCGLPKLLAMKLALLDFEARKDAAQVCGAIFRMDSNANGPGVRYVWEHPEILDMLFQGYSNPAIALNCGSMLRDCVRDENLARHAPAQHPAFHFVLVLEGPLFAEFFEKVEVTNFEVASDAFATFKDLLTRHKALVACFLASNYDKFFAQYTRLLQSTNYVTRRQSLKLLGELLLDRANVKVMMRYVGDPANLKLMMILLKDSSRSIQFEAFHVFKVFVANPNKTPAIVTILVSNRDKLLKYLGDFHTDKDDEQFKEEKAVIIKEISLLQPLERPSVSADEGLDAGPFSPMSP